MSARYFEDYTPCHGRAAPRAALDSDAPDFDDGSWDALRVPSHWQLHGYGRPLCVSIA
ncbi:hypothetical protein [Streptomyces sp. NPDC054797]